MADQIGINDTDLDDTEIDERARKATRSLTDAVAMRSVPAPREHPQRVRTFGVLAIVGAMLLVVAGLAVIPRLHTEPVSRSIPASVAPVTSAPQQPLAADDLRWVVIDLPAGWKLDTTEGPTALETPGPSAIAYYASADAPAGRIIAVVTSPAGPAMGSEGTTAGEVSIPGTFLSIADGPAGQRWVHNAEIGATVIGRNVDDATLERVAAAVTKSSDGSPLAGADSLPAGMMFEGSVTSINSDLGFDRRTTRAALSNYGPNNGASGGMFLAVTEASPLTSAAFGLQAENLTRSAGERGTLYALGRSDSHRSMMWTTPGLTFVLGSEGLTVDELAVAAKSVSPASATQWMQFEVDTQTTQIAATLVSSPDTTPPDTTSFCAALTEQNNRPESYVGSSAHISAVDALISVAPPTLHDALVSFRQFLASGFVTAANPASSETANWPTDVQAAIHQILSYQSTNC